MNRNIYASESVNGKCNQCNSAEVHLREKPVDSGTGRVISKAEYQWARIGLKFQ